MKIFSIETGNLKLDGGAMFGVVPKSMWQKIYPADQNNLCNWSMRCLLIDYQDKRVLIDTGMGDKQDEKFTRHYFLNGDDSLISSLQKLGYSPEDITDVIHTHLHFDHCGGTIAYNSQKNLIPTFANANIWVSKSQWELAIKPNRRERASFLKENILPMQECGKLKLVTEETDLLPNIFVKFYNGHTKGQIVPTIKFNDKYIIFCGDLIPAAAHVQMAYVPSYDMCAEQSLIDKEIFLNDALQKNAYLVFEHDIYNECANLIATEKGIRVNQTLKIKDIF